MVRRVTDAQKKERGTFAATRSDEAIAKGQYGKILAFPLIREIPKSKYPLNDGGLEVFEYWTQKLREWDLLTKISLDKIQAFALVENYIHDCLQNGKQPAMRAFESQRQYLSWLEGLNVDESIVSGEKKKNVFAKFGFAKRLSTPEAHKAKRTG